MRIYSLWPADREGLPAASSAAWRQTTRWLVLDVTDGLDAVHIVEGPVSREAALQRQLELRTVARRDHQGSKIPTALDVTVPLQGEVR